MDSAWLPNLFLDHESSDVQLRLDTSAGDQEAVVPIHSLVLRHASKVFRSMLDNVHFKEGRTGIVELRVKGSIDDAIFFLRYLYTREMENLDLNVYVSVLQTAHLYEVDDLVRLCNKRIAEDVTPLTVCQTYRQLKNVASEELLTSCKNLMMEFAFLIFRKNLHLTMDEGTMSILLASDKLNVLDEEQALAALWRWGRTRRTLDGNPEKGTDHEDGKLYSLIRAPSLNKELADSPWYRFLKNVKSPIDTNCKNRNPDRSNKIERFAEFGSISKVASQSKKITFDVPNQCLAMFSVDREILLAGLVIQITVGDKLSCQNMFQFFVNQEDLTQFISFERALLNEYTTQEMVKEPLKAQGAAEKPKGQKLVRDPYELAAEMHHIWPHQRSQYQQGLVTYPNQSLYPRHQDPPRPQVEQRPETRENRYYVYDLTLSLSTPIVLKKAERNVFSLRRKDDQRSSVLLTAYNFRENSTVTLSRKLKFTLFDDQIAVGRLYYFV